MHVHVTDVSAGPEPPLDQNNGCHTNYMEFVTVMREGGEGRGVNIVAVNNTKCVSRRAGTLSKRRNE